MNYVIIDKKENYSVSINLPFMTFQAVKKQFYSDETVTVKEKSGKGEKETEKKRYSVYPENESYFALVSVKSILHAVVSKQGKCTECNDNSKNKKQTDGVLLLTGHVQYNGKSLEKLNDNAGKSGFNENRMKYNVMKNNSGSSMQKLEKALSEIDNILYRVNTFILKYEFFMNRNIETFIENYINFRMKSALHDTQDIFSECRTAIIACNGSPEEKEKAGRKATHHYIYSFKKTETEYCLDDDNNPLPIRTILKRMFTENDVHNIQLANDMISAMKYLSDKERKTIILRGYGYTFERIAEIMDCAISTVKSYQQKSERKIVKIIPDVVNKYVTYEGYIEGIMEEEERAKQKNREKQRAYKARQKAKKELAKV